MSTHEFRIVNFHDAVQVTYEKIGRYHLNVFERNSRLEKKEVERAVLLFSLARMQFGLGLVLMPVLVLVVVLFHVEAISCGFVAVALAEARSVLKHRATAISVACACAVSCLQLLLIAGL